MKQLARYLLPPFILDAARFVIGRRPAAPGLPEWEYLPGGWDPKLGAGWTAEGVLKASASKWPQFLAQLEGVGPLGVSHESGRPSNHDYATHNTIMSFAYALGLAAEGKQRLSMLDWGGGIGHYYVIVRKLFPQLAIDYTCKDVPLLIQHGRTVLPDATFVDDDTCFNRQYDLVLASSSLQYARDWKATIGQLAGSVSGGGYLFITRTPFVRNTPTFAVLQRAFIHGYDTEYCGWFLNRREVLDEMAKTGLTLVREFLIDERPHVANAPEQCAYGGFLFSRKGSTV